MTDSHPEPVKKPTTNALKDHVFDFSKDEQYNAQGPHYMVELTDKQGFQVDLRYATTNNFTQEQIYQTGRCFLHNQMAERLKQANKHFNQLGYGIKLFDCYRPRPAQLRLWNAFPDSNYVGSPVNGSFHNRGLAVDLSLYELKNGNEVDMGTPFDYFGEKGWTFYKHLPKDILSNRKVLRDGLIKYGLETIPREWWHFNFRIPGAPLHSWEWK